MWDHCNITSSLSPCISPLNFQNPFPVCSRLNSAHEGHPHQIQKAEGSRSHSSREAATGKQQKSSLVSFLSFWGPPCKTPTSVLWAAETLSESFQQLQVSSWVTPALVLLAPGLIGGMFPAIPSLPVASCPFLPQPLQCFCKSPFPCINLSLEYLKYLEWLLFS